jgi:hypothetical protein
VLPAPLVHLVGDVEDLHAEDERQARGLDRLLVRLGDHARVERLGAEGVQKVKTWWVMRDPAGLLFCLLPMSPGSLNDENARRWE